MTVVWCSLLYIYISAVLHVWAQCFDVIFWNFTGVLTTIMSPGLKAQGTFFLVTMRREREGEGAECCGAPEDVR